MVAAGGACVVAPGGVGMHGCSGGCAWQRGACMAKGGVHGKGGHALQRGVCVVKGGMHGKGGHAW